MSSFKNTADFPMQKFAMQDLWLIKLSNPVKNS